MNRIMLAAMLAAGLSGCAAKLVAANERSVVVSAARKDAADAMRIGDAECAKHGLRARLKTAPFDDRTWVFDCVM